MAGHDAARTYQSPFLGPNTNTSGAPLLRFSCPYNRGCNYPKIGADQNIYLPQTYGNMIYVFNGISLLQSMITLPSDVMIVNIAFTAMNDLIILNWQNSVDLTLISYSISTSRVNWNVSVATNVAHPFYDIRISEPYIVLGEGDNLYVFNTNGNKMWSLLNANAITAISNGLLAAIVQQDLQVYALNNSTRLWSTFLPNMASTITIRNNTVFTCASRFTTATGCIASDLMTGKMMWERSFGNDILGISADGTLIVSDQTDIYFLDSATGKYLYGITGRHNYNGGIADNGIFYIGSLSASGTTVVNGWNFNTRLANWSYTINGYINTYIMLSGPGYLYVYDGTNNILYAFQ